MRQRMRTVVVVAASLALVLVPTTVADVGIRTCDAPSFCHDVANVPAPLSCDVDYVKGGLGKPGSVRTSCLT